MARRIAARATWEPLLVDTRTGEPLARSTRRYTPTQGQRDAIVVRDRTCTFPGCRVPAVRCDIDHITPYEPGRVGDPPDASPHPHSSLTEHSCGHQTCVENLHALCRHHHRAKTHAGWQPHRLDDGATTWRSPTGQTYVRPPEHHPPAAPPPAPPPDGVVIELFPPPPF